METNKIPTIHNKRTKKNRKKRKLNQPMPIMPTPRRNTRTYLSMHTTMRTRPQDQVPQRPQNVLPQKKHIPTYHNNIDKKPSSLDGKHNDKTNVNQSHH